MTAIPIISRWRAPTPSPTSSATRRSVGFQGKHWFYVAVEGRATIVRDKAQFEAHWTKDLDVWFEDGVDTPGLVMIHVKAERIHWWDKAAEREITL